MRRKPETAEQALARWHREGAYLRRAIDEGKAAHSSAAKIFPALHGRRVPAQQQQTEQKPNAASTLYPNLRRS
jgi:hypothetical protein